jgi:hypothetical protein
MGPSKSVKGSEDKTPVKPITVGGWYEHTDGTWGRYEWGGHPHAPKCLEVAARPPTREEADAAHEASEADYLAECARQDAKRHAAR